MTDITYHSLCPNYQIYKYIHNMQTLYNSKYIKHIDKSLLTKNIDSFIKKNILGLGCLIYIMNNFTNIDLTNAINIYKKTNTDIIFTNPTINPKKKIKLPIIYGDIHIEDFQKLIQLIAITYNEGAISEHPYTHLYLNIFNHFFSLFRLSDPNSNPNSNSNANLYKLNFDSLFDSHSVYYTYILDTLVSKVVFLKNLYYTDINKFKSHRITIDNINMLDRTINKIIDLNLYNIDIDTIITKDIIISNYIKLFDTYINDLDNIIYLIMQKYHFFIEIKNSLYEDHTIGLNIKTDFTILNTINHIDILINHINNPYYNLIKLYKSHFADKIKFYNSDNIESSNIKHIISNTYVLTYSDDIVNLLKEIILSHIGIFETNMI